MNTRKLIRELNHSLSMVWLPLDIFFYKKDFTEFKNQKIKDSEDVVSKGSKIYGKMMVNNSNHYLKIFKNAEELGISDNDLLLKWLHIIEKRKNDPYMLKPQKEGRDNKGVYVGNGGSNCNKVRYPSKKRSKRTWKIFYEMFPSLAKEDGWDGQKSNKM